MKRFNVRLREKDMLYALVIPAVLFTVFALNMFIAHRMYTKRAFERAEMLLVDSAGEQAAVLEARLEGYNSVLAAFAGAIAQQEDYSYAVLGARINAVCSATGFDSVTFTFPNGRGYTHNGKQFDVSDRTYFQKALAGEKSIEKLDSGKITAASRLVLAVPVVRGGRVAGVLSGTFLREKFGRMIKSTSYRGMGYTFICDSEGQLVIGSSSEKFLLSSHMDSNGSLFTAMKSRKMASEEDIERLREDMSNRRGGIIRFTIDGAERYAVYEPLEINDWVIFNALPSDVIEDEIRGVIGSGTAFMSILFLTALLTIFYIIQRERENRRLLAEEREKLSLSEQLYRVSAAQGGRNVYRYDVAAKTSYRDRTDDVFGAGRVTKNVPKSLIEAGYIAEESVKDYIEFYRRIDAGESPLTIYARLRQLDGQVKWYCVSSTTIFNAAGKPVNAIITYYDASEELDIKERAEVDGLTGALNRKTFISRVEELIAKRQEGRVHVLLLLDLDKFKEINDTYGHIAGDKALMDMADNIRSTMRRDDLFGRIGGDEFMLCLHDLPDVGVAKKKVRQICSVLRVEMDGGATATASIGAAVCPNDGETFEALYERADAALYKAKENGGGSYIFC